MTEGSRALAEAACSNGLADTLFDAFKKQVVAGLEDGGRRMDADEAAAMDDALEACRSLHQEALVASVAEVFPAEEISVQGIVQAYKKREDQLMVAMCARMPAVTAVFGQEFGRRMEALP